jgi:hypothetical protein
VDLRAHRGLRAELLNTPITFMAGLVPAMIRQH